MRAARQTGAPVPLRAAAGGPCRGARRLHAIAAWPPRSQQLKAAAAVRSRTFRTSIRGHHLAADLPSWILRSMDVEVPLSAHHLTYLLIAQRPPPLPRASALPLL